MATWILLRGLTRESGHWGTFAQQFATAMPGQRVITIDLPGNGTWHAQRSPSDVESMVEHCRAELVRFGVREPVQLFAMSLGAMVAVAWATRFPVEIAALVLVNTSLRPFSRFYQRLRPQNYALLLSLVLGRPSPMQWERSILQITSNTRPNEVLPRWMVLRTQHPVSRANALRQVLAAIRYQAPRHAPCPPVLLLASAQDQLVSCQCSVALAANWGCELRLHASAGHDIPLDDPIWVLTQLRRRHTAPHKNANFLSYTIIDKQNPK